MKVVLINPKIPPNTGNIARTCIANDIELVLVGNIGFDLSDSSLKRAGVDYWKHVRLSIYKDFDDFLKDHNSDDIIFLSTHGKKYFWDKKFNENSILVFGSETSGYPKNFYKKYIDRMYRIPMKSDRVRSLNLATSCGIVIYEALRQLNSR